MHAGLGDPRMQVLSLLLLLPPGVAAAGCTYLVYLEQVGKAVTTHHILKQDQSYTHQNDRGVLGFLLVLLGAPMQRCKTFH